MRTTVIIIFACFVVWAGYWFYGQSRHAEKASSWFIEQQSEGWLAEYGDLEVKGFPNRFDTIIENVVLADPKTGWAWEADRFQILSLSYRPNHVIFVFPPQHVLRTPKESFRIKNDEFMGSAVFDSGTDFELNRSTFTGQNITWIDERAQVLQDHEGKVGALNLATRKTPNRTDTHDIALDLEDVVLSDSFLSGFNGQDRLLTTLSNISLRATAAFDGPWDKPSLAGSGPDLTRLELGNLALEFPNMLLRAAGNLDIDRFGYPSGKLELRAENWEKLVSLAIQEGLLPGDLETTVVTGLQFIARLAGDPNNLDVTLNFSNQQVYLGPIPLGQAPILWPVQRQ